MKERQAMEHMLLIRLLLDEVNTRLLELTHIISFMCFLFNDTEHMVTK